MFESARWRITLLFAGVFTLILAVIGVTVLLTARASVFDQVDDDLVERANRGTIASLTQRPRDTAFDFNRPVFEDIVTAGGYFYAVVRADGQLAQHTSNTDEHAVVVPGELDIEGLDEAAFVDTTSSEGENLRVYVFPVGVATGTGEIVYMEIGRSTEPEREALRRLLLIMIGGGLGGIALAAAGGWLLSGFTLRPIRQNVGRQRAFVADASHELRTPLTLIRANAELMKRSAPDDAEVAHTAHEIMAETDRLSNLVGQMLTLARADTDQAALEMARVDLAEIAADTARKMRLLAQDKRIEILASTNGPVSVDGNDTRLRELVTILIDNSIKYSDEGSSVNVSVGETAGRAQLVVTDNGRGIPPESLPRIFDRFFRADKARSREMGGTGLGLAIARWIVDQHGGEIDIDSREGQGTTVSVELPVAAS